ncbi:hypothetical protein F5H01DRAFT_376563 [Linnemannia elongata]|nr:hypothetical protein F5H01DRAFT_376563 [Linnemannia elongata]
MLEKRINRHANDSCFQHQASSTSHSQEPAGHSQVDTSDSDNSDPSNSDSEQCDEDSDQSDDDSDQSNNNSDQSNNSSDQSDNNYDFNPEVYFNDLPPPQTYTIHLHLRSGEPLTQCRLIADLPDPEPWLHAQDDTYGMLYEIVRARALLNPDYTWRDDSSIYVQPNHHTPQKNFREIREDNFESVLEDAWRAEGRRLTILADIEVHLYAFVQPKERRNNVARRNVAGPNGLHRATKARTAAGIRKITSSVQNGIIPRVGPITMRHWGRHMARRPETVEDDVPLMDMPQNNTFRQTQHLDRELDDIRQRRLEDRAFYNEEYRALRFKIDGQVVELQVELRSLREALNLPDIDLHGLDDQYSGDDIPMLENDMEDEDHADLE